MNGSLAKGKARVGYVLPEKLIERIKIRAARERVQPSKVVEKILSEGINRRETETASA